MDSPYWPVGPLWGVLNQNYLVQDFQRGKKCPLGVKQTLLDTLFAPLRPHNPPNPPSNLLKNPPNPLSDPPLYLQLFYNSLVLLKPLKNAKMPQKCKNGQKMAKNGQKMAIFGPFLAVFCQKNFFRKNRQKSKNFSSQNRLAKIFLQPKQAKNGIFCIFAKISSHFRLKIFKKLISQVATYETYFFCKNGAILGCKKVPFFDF